MRLDLRDVLVDVPHLPTTTRAIIQRTTVIAPPPIVVDGRYGYGGWYYDPTPGIGECFVFDVFFSPIFAIVIIKLQLIIILSDYFIIIVAKNTTRKASNLFFLEINAIGHGLHKSRQNEMIYHERAELSASREREAEMAARIR